MTAIKKRYEIKAPVKQVWQALVDPKLIGEWGGGPATMRAKAGAAFSLWGGDITGKNLEVKPEKILKQDWRSSEFDDGERTTVEFQLRAKGGATELALTHTGVPDKNRRDIAAGWDDYYIGPLKELVEHG